MPQTELELIVHHPGVGNSKVEFEYPGVSLVKTENPENPDYLYVTLKITEDAKPGKIEMLFRKDKQKLYYSYELKERRKAGSFAQGVNPNDLIYLIMPDRFANGDPKNDIIAGTNEASINRDSMYWRHGGDLKGITQRLDYLQNLGITTLWLNPVQENDMSKTSYHGYAITDHYKIDPRFGSNRDYISLVDSLHSRGMKAVMDIVPNHIGLEHYLFKNLPSKDWVNQWDAFTRTTYRAPTLLDPYVSKSDLKLFNDGWFDGHMPDLNQRNPHVAKYLTQSYIWWIETAGIDDFRIDTYAYSDQEYMSQLDEQLLKLYPGMNMFGEIWEHGVTVQSYFAEGFSERDNNSYLPGTIDFQLYFAISDALTKPFGWTDGVARIYYTLAKDIMYRNPMRNVTFLDNHDLSRFYSVVGEDIRKYKMGIAFLLTMRGIPSVYYGTEILMTGFSNPDGLVRSDFPGGWPSDSLNKFQAEGRNDKENEAHDYFARLAQWRKTSKAATEGKLMQFVPEKSIYVYFRYTDSEKVMVIMNAASDKQTLNLDRFSEMLAKGQNGIDISENKAVLMDDKLELEPWDVKVIELK
ncbi:MAG: glycoside hydrolase family 13 protein [Bacteroidia bacterium]